MKSRFVRASDSKPMYTIVDFMSGEGEDRFSDNELGVVMVGIGRCIKILGMPSVSLLAISSVEQSENVDL